MTECKAKNKATCRKHGTVAKLQQVLRTSQTLSASDQFAVREMLQRAETPQPSSLAVGVAVHYQDGTSEIFTGDFTDPYYRTDYGFYSVETGEKIQGLNFNTSEKSDSHQIVEGLKKVSEYQKEFEEAEGNQLLLKSEDNETSRISNKSISKIIVL